MQEKPQPTVPRECIFVNAGSVVDGTGKTYLEIQSLMSRYHLQGDCLNTVTYAFSQDA